LVRDWTLTVAVLLPASELQFIDANGHPYAGGSLTTYVPATTTPKATWSEPTGTALNTNPIILDSAGRCIVYGDGVYRCILKDALGNQIWDQLSSTLISAAMQPVVIAPTIAAAVALLGIQAMIDASVLVETTRAEAAEAAELARALAAELVLRNGLAAEIARAEAAEAALGALISGFTVPTVVQLRRGTVTSAADGTVTVTFVPAFPNLCMTFGLDLASFDQTGGFQLVGEVLSRTTMAYTFTLGDGITARASQSANYYATGY
jgi:hypothetical protein